MGFIMNFFWLFLIFSLLLGFGIAGYYVDKNTNILEIEKKKRELKEKSMSVEALKNQIKNKNLSLGGTMGVKSGEAINVAPANNVSAVASQSANNQEEDLNAPLNLNVH